MPGTNRPLVLAVVPARYASQRFPGKIIAPLAGKPLVLHAYERACRARLVDETLIATDAPEVAEALAPYEARVVMTSPAHATGTDRIAEVARAHAADIVVNVQGDEALIDPATIDAAIAPLLADPSIPMSTACRKIEDPDDVQNPHVVKVVRDLNGFALYFSRCPIPYVREAADLPGVAHWQHIGLYVFRRDFLLSYAAMPQTPLELSERLEQLRVLEHGHRIAVIETTYEAVGVDTPADLAKVQALLDAAQAEGA